VGKLVGVTLGALGSARAVGVSHPVGYGTGTTGLVGAAGLTGMGFTVPLLFAAVAFAGHPGLFAGAQAGLLAGSMGAGLLGASVLAAAARAPRRQGH